MYLLVSYVIKQSKYMNMENVRTVCTHIIFKLKIFDGK